MRQLTRIAPVYAVKGKVDTGAYWDSWHIYDGTNVHELAGQVETLRIRGAELWIRGAGTSDYQHLPVNPPPPDRLSLYVFHYPDDILDVARDGYDLYLCGHSHGGQIALPFYGALMTFARFDKKYE